MCIGLFILFVEQERNYQQNCQYISIIYPTESVLLELAGCNTVHMSLLI